MTRVYIVRHGNTFDAGDVVTRVGARTDLPLSRSGHSQADNLAAAFLDMEPNGFAAAYCSPLRRTRQTAETILARTSQAPALETLEFLREVDYGPDENQPEDVVRARLGASALNAWDEAAIVPEGWLINPDAIREAWRNLFHTLAEAPPQGPVLLVTSNGIARFALASASTPLASGQSIKLKTGAFGRFDLAPDGTPYIAYWNIRPQTT